ncbi:MAG: hypothetical protein H0U34_03145, partial [Sphingomonas sp.]|nr:hypothetical protein [Sphingomonas sp.]
MRQPEAAQAQPLRIAKADVGRGSAMPFEVVADAEAITAHFADALLDEYR